MVIDVQEFERLSAALDQFGDVDPTDLSAGAVHRVLIGRNELTAKRQAATMRFASAWDHSGVWAEDGSPSPAHRLARETNAAPRSCRRITRLGRKLDSMPATAESLSFGRINVDHVELLTLSDRRDERTVHQAAPTLIAGQDAPVKSNTGCPSALSYPSNDPRICPETRRTQEAPAVSGCFPRRAGEI